MCGTAIKVKESMILRENKRVAWEEFEGGKERGKCNFYNF